MRIFPKSLFGRFILVLFVGLVVAQFFSVYFMLRDRGETLLQLYRDDVATRTVTIVQLLNSSSSKERLRLLQALNGPATRISIVGSSIDETAPSPSAVILRKRLSQELGGYSIKVSTNVIEATPQSEQEEFHSRMMRMMQHQGTRGLMHGNFFPVASFRIQVQLTDNQWVLLESVVPKELLDWPSRLLWSVAFSLLGVLVVSLVSVRWITKPLRMLSEAANELGRDIQRPKLKVDGPTEVAEAAIAFNTMQQRLIRFIGDRSRILAAISHDLKTPITRLRLRSALLDDELIREKFENDLDDMERMVRETLDFMRGVEVGETSQPIDIAALIESMQDDAREAGWPVEVNITNVSPIVAKPVALKRCLSNLLSNAVHYGNSADIVVFDNVNTLTIIVRDSGSGVPESELEKLFEPFYRAEDSRNRHTGGSGLGLSIARNIARAHGGDVTLKNGKHGGLEAILTLPR